MSTGETLRNSGLDVLRLLSMLMVCVLHVNFRLQITEIFPNFLCETVCIQAVDLFAMLTGYLCIGTRWKVRRYLNLWFQVAFYSVGFLAVGCVLKYVGVFPAFEPNYRKALLPVPLAGEYWYFTAYTAVFLLAPFLNRLMAGFTRKEARALLLIVVPVFSLMTLLRGTNVVYGDGYNAAWLISLYVLGAYLKMYPLKWTKLAASVTLACSLAFSALLYHARILDEEVWGYSFPLVVLSSVCIFHLCVGMTIKSRGIVRVTTYLSPLAFGVYLVHCHQFPWFVLQKVLGYMHYYTGHTWWFVPLFGLGLFLVCIGVDWCRAQLFRLLGVSRWAERLAAACPAWLRDLEKM